MTLEGLGARVFSIMSGQLVRSGKFPCAAFPGTFVGLFARMGPLVSLEVRTFGVDFIALGKITLVHSTSF